MWHPILLAFSLLLLASLAHTYHLQIPLPASTTHGIGSMPLLGFGTWNVGTSNASEVVSTALLTGYRHLDCAAIYGNEKEVGQGIAHGLAQAGLKREDIWITSKLWNDHHEPSLVEEALETTLRDLRIDYLDSYLMHWPVASIQGANKIYYLQTWHAMENLLAKGKVRHIGVSNFSPGQLKHLIANSKSKPAFHQFELHPYLQQQEWVKWHKDNGINVTAYSPLANMNPIYGHPTDGPPLLLEHPVITSIALARDCTPAQVVLLWGIHRGTSVIPKSTHAERIKEDFETLRCVLREEDYEKVTALGDKYSKRFNNPSKGWGVDLYEGLEGT